MIRFVEKGKMFSCPICGHYLENGCGPETLWCDGCSSEFDRDYIKTQEKSKFYELSFTKMVYLVFVDMVYDGQEFKSIHRTRGNAEKWIEEHEKEYEPFKCLIKEVKIDD